jgi:Flp pilus assembly protein TadD
MTDSFAIDSLKRRAGIQSQDPVPVVPHNLPSDPLEARTILEELINKNENENIIQLTSGLNPDPYWVDIAIIALVRSQKWQQAQNYFDLAVAHSGMRPTLPGKAMFAATNSLLSPHIGKEIIPGKIFSNEENKFSEHILKDIDRRLNSLITNSGLQNDLDRDLCIQISQLSALLGKPERASKAIQLLLNQTKEFPKILAIFMEREVLTTHPEIPNRLRIDKPEDLDSHLLAATIEGRILKNPKIAFEKLLQKRYLAKADEDILKIETLLAALAEASGDEVAKTTITELKEFWRFSDSRLRDLTEAEELINKKDLVSASQLIDKWKEDNDLLWLSAMASLRIAEGNKQEAAKILFKLAQFSPHWINFISAAELAFSCQDWDLARKCLEEALIRKPKDWAIRNNLILTCEKQNRLEDVEYLLKDFLSEPAVDLSFRLKYVRLLMEQSRYSEALGVISEDPSSVDMNLESALLKAELIRMTKSPQHAYKYIHSLTNIFQEAKQYWFALLELSYAAGEDERGHEALEKLLALKRKGLVSDRELWSESIDELRSFMREQHEQHKQIMQYVAQGKLPWLSEVYIKGGSAWLLWTLRTQPLTHLWDQPSQKVEYSIYSTNGFLITRDENIGHLAEVSPPKHGSDVVVDLSALMTLTQLGLLDHANKFFNQIFIPKRISSLLLLEDKRLRPHQKSQFDTAAILVKAIGNKYIKNYDLSLNEFEGLILDPYKIFNCQNSVGYPEILTALRKSGKLTEAEFHSCIDLFGNQESIKETGLTINSKLLVEETALRMLARKEILEKIYNSFEVLISSKNASELQSQVRAYEALDRSRQANEVLAKWIATSQNIYIGHSINDKDLDNWTNDAYQISGQQNLPLLADDRVWHAIRANDLGNGLGIVFDSSAFIRALRQSKLINIEEQSSAFLKLISWRYKFIIVPAEILHILAIRYRAGLPGDDLRKIAQYLHDSSSDPAIFGGIEPVEPPSSMAARWVLSWVAEVSKFLVMAWSDERITDDQCSELTMWSARCLLPSSIANMTHAQKVHLVSSIPTLAISHFMIEGMQSESLDRVHNGFKILSKGLGIDKDKIDQIVEDIIKRTVT